MLLLPFPASGVKAPSTLSQYLDNAPVVGACKNLNPAGLSEPRCTAGLH